MGCKIGDERYNNIGNKMTIIKIVDDNHYDLRIDHVIDSKEISYVKENVNHYAFMNGSVRSPYDITIRYFGYIGEGEYTRNHRVNGKLEMTKEFQTYERLLIMCEESSCPVSPMWRDFQKFCRWFNRNQYKCKERLIMVRLTHRVANNRTCVLLPASIGFPVVKFLDNKRRFPKITNERINRISTCIDELNDYKDIIPDKFYKRTKKALEQLIK